MHKAIVYHTISAPPVPLPADIDISPERFETHLRWLSKRRKRVVPLRQTLCEPAGSRLIAITFDDGYRDNLTVALPLLEKYDLPATLFVAAGLIGQQGYLTAEDLKLMADHPLIEIGSHTLSHLHITRIPREMACFELLESKRILEGITGKAIDLLAYPYGDCSPAIERLSEQCGYQAAWSVWNGSNTPFSRWRVPLGRNDGILRFIAKVSGAYFPVKRRLRPPIVAGNLPAAEVLFSD
jgi:peptidoglycan/xylan/chitin deacetylase (PgdA/CDA1 family)